jgi:membrane protease YdiL (CAAX protease family)
VTVAASLTAAPPARRAAAPLVVLAALAALLARPLLPHSTGALVALFVALGLVGVAWPVARPVPTAGATAVGAVVLGIAAFAAGRLLGATTALALPTALTPLLLNALAAVAEEAFFRRFLYGLLASRGTAVAVAGSAVCFAAVHVTVWGVGVLPLDLAAGLLLSWQRAATGRWSVPAFTHVAANLLAAL